MRMPRRSIFRWQIWPAEISVRENGDVVVTALDTVNLVLPFPTVDDAELAKVKEAGERDAKRSEKDKALVVRISLEELDRDAVLFEP